MLKSLLIVGALSLGFSANAAFVSEDFTQGSYDTGNFTIDGATGSVLDNGFAGGSSRSLFSTLVDGWVGSVNAPLRIQADLTFTAVNDIAFLAFRSDAEREASYFNEPADSVYIRMHNFGNGQTDTVWGGVNYITGGAAAQNPIQHINANLGDPFYDSTVRINVIDYGNLIEITLTNLLTSATYNTSFNTHNSFGSFVAFSSDTARFDNIQISNEPVANVSAPFGVAGMTMALFGLAAARKRKRTA